MGSPVSSGGAQPTLVAGRYQLQRELGRGGMAVVHEALDITSGRLVALKQLRTDQQPERLSHSIELFEREFHTLCQLAHPRIVEVYDYGIDGSRPYYTMELLDGGDLLERSPLPWQTACAIARDICSALSLVHSRRMVYRDISPRNVRCTNSGEAKLIDFGAMGPFGVTKIVLGTPAMCAPEVVRLQPLDARTDLYSLGATLYQTLVGRRAYPARSFRDLPELWRQRPKAPSEHVPSVPKALDALVMDLLQLDPGLRPSSAAEVMERLSAIAGLEIDEQLVAQAYLATPTLVGRELLLDRVRRKVARTMRGQGGAALIEGAPGVGRSRFLDACVLAGKLAGMTVLRADASEDTREDYAAVRALASQLLEALPELATELAGANRDVLGLVVPHLRTTLESGAADRALLQPALRAWFMAIGRQQPLMIAVDDVHRIDEASASLVALLAHQARDGGLLVIASAESGVLAASLKRVLHDAGSELALDMLPLEDTERLLSSVFGDAPHVRLVASKLHAIANGSPRSTLLLAQHLVDKGLVRYSAGSWSLPDHIDQSDLPASMAQALKARVERLGAQARELAQAMALSPGQRFSFEDCLPLTEDRQAASLVQTLDELTAAEVVARAGELYALAQQGWVPALSGLLSDERARLLQLRLSEMFERRGGEGFRVAQHLLLAGETERGLDALIQHANATFEQRPDAFFKHLQSLPSDWLALYDLGIELCRKHERPRKQIYVLQNRVAAYVSNSNSQASRHVVDLLEGLARDSGLDLYASLDASLAPEARLKQALALAKQRYDNAPEHERLFEPDVAIRHLCRMFVATVSVIGLTLDRELCRLLPSLKPLEPLSPMVGVLRMLGEGIEARITGRSERARMLYLAIIARLDEPDRAEFDATYWSTLRLGVMFVIGTLEASMGLASSLDWAERIESSPLHHVNALQIRMLHHLWQGDSQQAESCKRKVEMLRIERVVRQPLEGVHLLRELPAYALADDLIRVKQIIGELEKMADRYPGWRPVLDCARGEYQRIRGDYPAALTALEAALAATDPGGHAIWADAAAAKLRVLYELGRHEEARAQGETYLRAALGADLGYACQYIRMPLALSQAKLGDVDDAVANADAAIAGFEWLGSSGINLTVAYETRAWVALHLADQSGFERHVRRCIEQVRSGENRALSAKHEKLIAHARAFRKQSLQPPPGARPVERHEDPKWIASNLRAVLATCAGPDERARRSLQILLDHSGCEQGFLYAVGEPSAAMRASLADHKPPEEILALMTGYLSTQMEQEDTTRVDFGDQPSSGSYIWTARDGRVYCPVLLSHPADAGVSVTGLVLLLVEPGAVPVQPFVVAAALSKMASEWDK